MQKCLGYWVKFPTYVKMREIKKHIFGKLINELIIDLPAPSNINYWWNVGSLLGMCLFIQILTGILLGMHYSGDVSVAFDSVEHLMREVNSGYLIRYAHANGGSLFFVMVYVHIGRGMYYGSYKKPREIVWSIGVIIFILMMATAFMGYVLPWGQMSYWGATVITSMLSAIPFVGKELVLWLWGGFAVINPTLVRFYSLHYLMPFIITGLVVLHIIALHRDASNNPIGHYSNSDKIVFHPYYVFKDVLGGLLVICFYIYFVYYLPNLLGHPDNYIQANNLVTPSHIVPEWYFLYAYAILRAFPNKLGGVLALFASIIVLFGSSLLHTSILRTKRKSIQIFFWIFVFNFFILTWLGGKSVEPPFVYLSLSSMLVYFLYLLIIIPLLGLLENKSYLQN